MIGKKQKFILRKLRDKSRFTINDFKSVYASKNMLLNSIIGLEAEGFVRLVGVGVWEVNKEKVEQFFGESNES